MIPLEHLLTRVVGVTLLTFRHTSWCLLQENKLKKRQYLEATSMIKYGASLFIYTHARTHRALTCLDKGPETGGFSHVLGVVGIISIFMY